MVGDGGDRQHGQVQVLARAVKSVGHAGRALAVLDRRHLPLHAANSSEIFIGNDEDDDTVDGGRPKARRNAMDRMSLIGHQLHGHHSVHSERRKASILLFKTLDIDYDGRCTQDEMLAVGMSRETFAAIDADGNGAIGKAEFRAWYRENLEAAAALADGFAKTLWDKLDIDGDGALTRIEMSAM